VGELLKRSSPATRRRSTSAGRIATAPRLFACRCTSRKEKPLASSSARRIGVQSVPCVFVMLAAGLDGIERGPELPPDVSEDVYEMTDAQRLALGITQLSRRPRRGPSAAWRQ
jgi:hypothetical protein